MDNVLEIKNLTKYYGKTKGIQNLSLKINGGEIFGFIGPNGAGKSTTIRCIMNLINKSSGAVYINGEIFDKDRIDLKSMIGYLPSEIYLYEEMPTMEMILYHESFYKQIDHKKRDNLIKRLGLDTSKKIGELSLGNKKKLAIILALIHNPKILILDEATSGLDPIIQQELYKILMEEKKRGTLILYSTHVLSEISKICDRVGIIKDGNLLKILTIKDLNKNSLSKVTLTSKDYKQIMDELKVEYKVTSDNTVKFDGEIGNNLLLKVLSKHEIDKLYITEPTLEDLFLKYYEPEEK